MSIGKKHPPTIRPKQWVDDEGGGGGGGGGYSNISGTPPGMNTQGKLSIAALVFGVVVLAVLVAVGLVAKQAVHDEILSRLVYKLPDGYKSDPDYQECYRSTVGMFYDEYYLWNLTNPADFFLGAKPDFNLTGMPFSSSSSHIFPSTPPSDSFQVVGGGRV